MSLDLNTLNWMFVSFLTTFFTSVCQLLSLQSISLGFWDCRFPELKHTHTLVHTSYGVPAHSTHNFTLIHTHTHIFIQGSNQPCNSDVRANLSGRKCFLMKSFINFNTTCQLTWCMLAAHSYFKQSAVEKTAGCTLLYLKVLPGYGCQRRETPRAVTPLDLRRRDFTTNQPCQDAACGSIEKQN